MKKLHFVVLLLLSLGIFSCTDSKTEKASEYPMFWTWMDYRPGVNFDSICQVMNETGIDGVMLNAPSPDDYRVAIPIAQKHGIEVYAWLWTMNLEHDRETTVKEHPEWFSVNRDGESLVDKQAYVGYYKFMTPALPEVREHIQKKIRAYCEVEGLNGIAIDYHRFVDVVLPTTLWPKYDVVQDKEYPEFDYGYHPAMIKLFEAKHGYDPREQEDPSKDLKWRQFRCDQITEVANEIAETVHSYGKVMAASPFPTPAMSSRMVRQDWGKWNLDIVFPMVYHNFYTGDVSFISDCTIENTRDKNPMTTLYCGMSGTNGPVMFESMDAALNNGAEGIAIFTIRSLRSPEIRKQFKIYADSARASRKAGKPDKAVLNQKTVDSNPFNNKGIMEAVNLHVLANLSLVKALNRPEFANADRSNMQRIAKSVMRNSADAYISGLKRVSSRNENLAPMVNAIIEQFLADNMQEEINLGTFELVNETDVAKYYRVKEENSNQFFEVSFYFYGGIISGWNVQAEPRSNKNS